MRKINIIFYGLLLSVTLTSFAKAQTPSTKRGMVVSEQIIASQIGADILRRGGNAIDAAVAVGYALAVVNPCCGNIGGGGFMTIHLANGKNIFINFREKAPGNANEKMYLDKEKNVVPNQSTQGYLSVAIPGTVLGFETALQKYGSMTRQQVMAPAIDLAKNGYIVTPYDVKLFNLFLPDFKKQQNVAAIFLKNGLSYQAGDRLIQTDLANTLTLIAKKGPAVFYQGEIAKQIVAASNAHGGMLTLADFKAYQVNELSPIQCHYRGHVIISAPPPSSGGVALCEMLNILENFPLKKMGYHAPQSIRVIVEAMRYGFADRNMKLGDPDFVKNPVAMLISKKYAKHISEKIKHTHFIKSTNTVAPELSDTTHYSILDRKGNAVAVTYTLNGFFGARVMAENTGFFLNDEMDDFAIKAHQPNKFGLVQSDKNNIQAGKRPLSSMAPTIVMRKGKVLMVIGSPGGPRIITSVLLALLNVIDYKMPLKKAVNAPRFHYQGQPDIIHFEPGAISLETIKRLQKLGYQLAMQKTWGAVEAILVDQHKKKLAGVNDARRPSGGAVEDIDITIK